MPSESPSSQPPPISWKGVLQTLGPGILLAGAAIGGSHLVQSTKAGALYGFALVWAVLLATLFKYPFFEYTNRYTAATGESVVDGYNRMGKWAIRLFLMVALGSAFINIAGVTVISAALLGNLLPFSLDIFWCTLIIICVCVGLLWAGRYPALDFVIKLVVCVLAVSTITAVSIAAKNGLQAPPDFQAPFVWNATGIAFLIALMGWMPAPIDVAVWPSLWSVERQKQTGHRPTLFEALFDFNMGYAGTFILALAFLSLGALVMFGTGETPEAKGIAFAHQLIRLYTRIFGNWSTYFIAVAAFTCMFSTALTTLDGYTRTIHSSLCLVFKRENVHREDKFYWIIMAVFFCTTLLIVGLFMRTMGSLINFATTMAFLTAPLVAFLNFRLILSPHMPRDKRPPLWMLVLSWLGMFFLLGFAGVYLWSRFL